MGAKNIIEPFVYVFRFLICKIISGFEINSFMVQRQGLYFMFGFKNNSALNSKSGLIPVKATSNFSIL